MLLTALTAVVLAKYIFFINQTMNSMPAVLLLAVWHNCALIFTDGVLLLECEHVVVHISSIAEFQFTGGAHSAPRQMAGCTNCTPWTPPSPQPLGFTL